MKDLITQLTSPNLSSLIPLLGLIHRYIPYIYQRTLHVSIYSHFIRCREYLESNCSVND